MKDLETLATSLSTAITKAITSGKLPEFSTNMNIANVIGNTALMKSPHRGEKETWTDAVYKVVTNEEPKEFTKGHSRIAKQLQTLAAYYNIVDES